MKKYLLLSAVLMMAACGKKEEAVTPAAATPAAAAPAPAAPDSMAKPDSTMARDTTHKM
jgi:hypothetical protein